MRRSSYVRLALFAAAPLLLSAPALAATFAVAGSVTKLLDYPPPGVSVALGDPVTGTFTLLPTAGACPPSGPCGSYSFTIGGIHLSGSFESALVTNQPPASEDALLVLDQDPTVPGFPCAGACLLDLEFRDPSGAALSSTDLAAALLALPTWPGTLLLDTGDFLTFQELQVTFTSVTPVSAPVAVPALPLAGLLVASLASAGAASLRRRAQASSTRP